MAAWGMLFPLTVSGWTATPSFKTDITTGINGREVRNALWQDPLHYFNAALAIRSLADAQTLKDFFLAVKGREQSFLVKDYEDYTIDRTTIGTGDGSDTTFQLVKVYVNAVAGNYTRTITKPKQVEGVGGVRVWVNNVELAASAFAFSSSTGIITLSVAPSVGHVVEASCDEFYVPCRFDTDELPVEMFTYWLSGSDEYSLVQIPDIPLREVIGE